MSSRPVIVRLQDPVSYFSWIGIFSAVPPIFTLASKGQADIQPHLGFSSLCRSGCTDWQSRDHKGTIDWHARPQPDNRYHSLNWRAHMLRRHTWTAGSWTQEIDGCRISWEIYTHTYTVDVCICWFVCMYACSCIYIYVRMDNRDKSSSNIDWRQVKARSHWNINCNETQQTEGIDLSVRCCAVLWSKIWEGGREWKGDGEREGWWVLDHELPLCLSLLCLSRFQKIYNHFLQWICFHGILPMFCEPFHPCKFIYRRHPCNWFYRDLACSICT